MVLLHFYLIFLNFLSVFTVFIFFFFNEVKFSISLSDVSLVLEWELLLLKSTFLFDLLFSKIFFPICFFEENNKMILDNIIPFCEIEEAMNLLSFNKKFCKEERIKYINNLIKNFGEKQIEQKINEIENKNEEALNNPLSEFQLSKYSLKIIEE